MLETMTLYCFHADDDLCPFCQRGDHVDANVRAANEGGPDCEQPRRGCGGPVGNVEPNTIVTVVMQHGALFLGLPKDSGTHAIGHGARVVEGAAGGGAEYHGEVGTVGRIVVAREEVGFRFRHK